MKARKNNNEIDAGEMVSPDSPSQNTGHRNNVFWVVLGSASVGFHLWLIFSGLIPNLVSRPLHMAFMLPWILIYAATTDRQRNVGLVLTTLGCVACLWLAFNHQALGDQYGSLSGSFQHLVAIFLLLLVLEAARRSIGWPLPLVAVVMLSYGLFGQQIPGEFGHAGIPLASFLGTLVIAEGGLWGSLSGVSVSIISIFVIFGAVLNAGEAGRGFMNVARAAAGRLRGGAAKVSVLSSAFFGSISGSASANVASTGAVTLPAMLRLGYPKTLAAAVEAVASSGGQIMPPLMGAGAFVMVELTGTPYTDIMAAALLPALLFFIAVWVGINAFADRYQLKALEADEQPGRRELLVTSVFFVIPFSVLLSGIFFSGYTPQFAASLAILVAAVLLPINDRLKINLVDSKTRFKLAVISAGRQIALIASIILCAAIVVGVLGITGLGVKITSVIVAASDTVLWPALLLTAIACLVLGMEVPTTAAYLICVSVAGPALIDLGLAPLQAHLFVFWFALLSTITPPVCGAVFIAASLVEASWLKVAGVAMLLGIGLYLIPIGMIVSPELIDLRQSPLLALMTFVKIAIALTLLSYGCISPRSILVRIMLVLAGLGLFFFSWS